jgi:hypothetical protein
MRGRVESMTAFGMPDDATAILVGAKRTDLAGMSTTSSAGYWPAAVSPESRRLKGDAITP